MSGKLEQAIRYFLPEKWAHEDARYLEHFITFCLERLIAETPSIEKEFDADNPEDMQFLSEELDTNKQIFFATLKSIDCLLQESIIWQKAAPTLKENYLPHIHQEIFPYYYKLTQQKPLSPDTYQILVDKTHQALKKWLPGRKQVSFQDNTLTHYHPSQLDTPVYQMDSNLESILKQVTVFFSDPHIKQKLIDKKIRANANYQMYACAELYNKIFPYTAIKYDTLLQKYIQEIPSLMIEHQCTYKQIKMILYKRLADELFSYVHYTFYLCAEVTAVVRNIVSTEEYNKLKNIPISLDTSLFKSWQTNIARDLIYQKILAFESTHSIILPPNTFEAAFQHVEAYLNQQIMPTLIRKLIDKKNQLALDQPDPFIQSMSWKEREAAGKAVLKELKKILQAELDDPIVLMLNTYINQLSPKKDSEQASTPQLLSKSHYLTPR